MPISSWNLSGAAITVPHAAATRVDYNTTGDALATAVEGGFNTIVASRCVVRNMGFIVRVDVSGVPCVVLPFPLVVTSVYMLGTSIYRHQWSEYMPF